MDIRLPLTGSVAVAVPAGLPLRLQLGQLLEAKIVSIDLEGGKLALQIGHDQLHLQNPPRLDLKPGQTIALQVASLEPVTAFRIIAQNQSPETDNRTLRLSHSSNLRPTLPLPAIQTAIADLKLTRGQLLHIQVHQLQPNSLGVKLLSGDPSFPSTMRSLISIELGQLRWRKQQPSDLRRFLQQNMGQTLALKVIRSGENPQFQIVTSPPVPQRPVDALKVVNDSLKQHLPSQAPLSTLLQQLGKLIPQLQAQESVSAALKRLAQEIMHSIADRSALTAPESLKKTIEQSGRWLEAKLILSETQPALLVELRHDLKLKVLQLIAQLKLEQDSDSPRDQTEGKLLKELLSRAEGSLAKIVVDQLSSLPKEEGNKLSWLLDLPISFQNQIESLQMEIETDASNHEQADQNNWSVTLTLSPPQLGIIHCKLNCINQRVSSRFWAEKEQTRQKIDLYLTVLEQRLQEKGIKIGTLDVRTGKPDRPNPANKWAADGLIREKA